MKADAETSLFAQSPRGDQAGSAHTAKGAARPIQWGGGGLG